MLDALKARRGLLRKFSITSFFFFDKSVEYIKSAKGRNP
jgi:hypothetical protein